jgi:WD40 repeat protein
MHLTKAHVHIALLVTFALVASPGLAGQRGLAPPKESPPPAKGEPLPQGALVRMGNHRFWQTGYALALAVSADDTRVALLDDQGTIHLWDAATGKQVDQIPQAGARLLPNGKSRVLRFSPDGKLLALGDGSDSVYFWDLSTRKLRFQIRGEQGITRFAFSPEGKTLATVGGEAIVRLWSVKEGKETGQLKGHEGRVTAVVYSVDGQTLVTGSDDQSVILWDVASGKVRRQLRGHRHRVTQVAISPNGKQVASSGLDETIRIWQASTGKEVRRWQGTASGLAFSADGSVLAAIGNGSEPPLHEVATGRVLVGPADLSVSWVGSMVHAFSRGGEYLLTWQPVVDAPLTSKISGGRIRWTPLPGGQGPASLGSQVHARASAEVLAWSPDGKILASGGPSREVILWDAHTGKRLRQCQGHLGPVVALAFHPDPRRALLASAAGSPDRTISLWDVTTGQEVGQLRGKDDRDEEAPITLGNPWGLTFSPAGNLLACQGYIGSGTLRSEFIWVWEVSEGNKSTLVREFTGRLTAPVFSPDGKALLVLGFADPPFSFSLGTPLLRRWDVRTWGENVEKAPWLVSPDDLESGGLDPVLSPDGRLLVLRKPNKEGDEGHRGATLGLWDTQRRRCLATRLSAAGVFAGNPCSISVGGPPQYVSFSPDGKAVAACGLDGRIHVWEVASGGERCQLVGNRHGISSLCFAPDGKRLASGSPDGTLLIWDVTGMNGADQGAEPLTDKALTTLWADLKEEDAARAYQAICRLQNAPDRAVPFFTAHFEPARGPDPAEIAKLIADLDSDRFAVRQAAEDKLRELGEQARPALEKALANKSSLPLGVRRTIENLLKRGESRTPEHLRQTRAIEVLETIGTPASQRLLERLAGGAPGMHLTRLAQESLLRLKPRFGTKP